MKKKASPFRHLFLSKNFILMLVMLVVIVIAVSAWFTVHKTVEATNITVKAESSEIDIAPCIKTYDASHNVLTDGPGEFSSTVTFSAPSDFGVFTKDCTGDGEYLWVPDFNVTNDFDSVRRNGGKEVNANVSGKEAISQEYARIEGLKNPEQDAPEYQFIELEFYARSKNENLRLTAESTLLSETEKDGFSLSVTSYSKGGSTVDKKSAYGNFNVDGLVGAMRVSLLGEACNEVKQDWAPKNQNEGYVSSTDAPNKSPRVKQLLWYPRPDVGLVIPETSGDITNWTLDTNLTSGATFTNTYYTNIGGGLPGMTLISNDTDAKTKISSAAPALGENTDISDFSSLDNFTRQTVELVVDKDHYTEKSNYYVTKYILRIWIEGTDSEARRAMDGGKFDLTLKFM